MSAHQTHAKHEAEKSALPAWQGALLLRKIGTGDENAFESLYRACSDRLYSMALHWLNDEQIASEALQDCFMRIWKSAERYDAARSAPFTWCCIILRGICLDHLRKKKRIPLLLDDLAITPTVHVDDLLFHESVSHIRHAFEKLSPSDREVINAALFDPATTRQLSQRWQIPLATAKTRIHRAMVKLRKLLTP